MAEQKYKTLVTDIGDAKIAQAALAGDKVDIWKAAVGDGGGAYYSPTADQTALVREVWRGDIAQKQINSDAPEMIDIKVFIPAEYGGWTVREVGLFDKDGDLIVIANTPDIEKALAATGAAASLDLFLHVIFSDMDSVEIIVEPSIDPVTHDELNAALSGKLDKAGGTMSGNIAMGSNRITGLADGVNSSDAVTKSQVDAGIAAVEERLGGITFSIVDGALIITYEEEGEEE